MLLAIDIGNTNLHLGLWDRDENRWRGTWRAHTVHQKMGDEYAVLIRNYLAELHLDFSDVQEVVLGSVVPILTEAFRELSIRYFKVKPLVIDHTTHTGIKIDIDMPQQVGADRIVNTAAVHAIYGGGPAIVIDFGTATTFDVISCEGSYIGGVIAPGIHLAVDALISRSARLFNVNLEPPPSPIGRNTTEAVQSGIFLGYVSLIEGMVARIKSALAEKDCAEVRVIATGGLAPLFREHTPVIEEIAELLTLDGLRVIQDLNR